MSKPISQLSDEEFAALEAKAKAAPAGGKKPLSEMSDEEFYSLAAQHAPQSKTLGQGLSDVADTAYKGNAAFAESLSDMVPLSGAIKKGAAGAMALGAELGEQLGITTPKDLGQRYKEFKHDIFSGGRKVTEESPIAASAAKLIGIPLAGPPIKAGTVLSPGLAGAAKRIAGTGALLTADMATKGEETDLKKGVDAGKQGALIAAAIESAIPTLKVVAPFVRQGFAATGDVAKTMGAERAAKAVLGYGKKAFREVIGKGRDQLGKLREFGAEVLEKPPEWLAGGKLDRPLKFGAPVSGQVARAEENAKKAWGVVEEVYDAADNVGAKVDGNEIADAIAQRRFAIDRTSDEGQAAFNALEALEQRFRTRIMQGKDSANLPKPGWMTLKEAQQLKNSFVFKHTDPRTHALGRDGNQIAREAITDAMENTLTKVDGDLAGQWREGMKWYGTFATIAKDTSDQAIANVVNRFFSPTDHAIGIAGFLASQMRHVGTGQALDVKKMAVDAVTGVALATANKIVRGRGNAVSAVALNNLAKGLAAGDKRLGQFVEYLDQAGRVGVDQFMIAHSILMQNPEYRDAVMPEPKPEPGPGPGLRIPQQKEKPLYSH